MAAVTAVTAVATAAALAAAIATAATAAPDTADSTRPPERLPVAAVRPLLQRAAAQGEAFGVLTGSGAQAISRRFRTDAPIEIDVRRLHALPQPGCARLEVTTRQRDVVEDGPPRPMQLVYQVSACADGRLVGAP